MVALLPATVEPSPPASLTWTHVPVIVLGHLTENQRRAFMLADNKLASNAGWDEEMLRLVLEALAEQDFELALTGFNDQEFKDLLIAESQRADPNDLPELPQTPTTKLHHPTPEVQT